MKPAPPAPVDPDRGPKAKGKAKGPRRRRTLSVRGRQNRDGLLLIAPTILVVAGVVAYPFVRSVDFAFHSIRLVDLRHVGLFGGAVSLDNFRHVLADPGVWTAFRTTLIYSLVSTVGSVGVGLIVALALRKPFRGRALVRGLMLVPYVLPVVAAASTWSALLNPQYGPINAFGLRYLGWNEPINFLSTESTEVFGVHVPVALSTVIAFEIWRTFPLAYLFITARLQAIPKELEEATLIDGATPIQTFRYLIFPQLAGVITLLAVLRVIWSFHNFTDIYLLTQGAGGTEVVAVRVYDEFSKRADIGAASALGTLFTIVLTVFLALYVWLSRKEETE